jgi:hypothetical protein
MIQRSIEERRFGEHRQGGGAAALVGLRQENRVVFLRQYAL